MSNPNVKLNPSIKEVQVGVYELKTVKIYPLSVAKQFELTDIIEGVIQQFLSGDFEEMGNELLVTYVVSAIKDNSVKIIEYVTKPGEVSIDDLTIEQLYEIGNIIYDTNYKTLVKNLKDLFNKMKTKLDLKGSLQKFSETQATV